MNVSELIARLRSAKPALSAEGVEHIALFGSRARGDFRPNSDIDLLVDIYPGSRFSLLSLVGVERIVENATGLKSNAIMRRSLGPSFRNSITSDVIEVF